MSQSNLPFKRVIHEVLHALLFANLGEASHGALYIPS